MSMKLTSKSFEQQVIQKVNSKNIKNEDTIQIFFGISFGFFFFNVCGSPQFGLRILI